jgi:hypothetical protein
LICPSAQAIPGRRVRLAGKPKRRRSAGYRIAGDPGELLDAGCDIDRVADKVEFEMTCATDGPGDDNAGVDPDADRKLAGELLGNKAMNQHRSGHDGIGMIREAIRGTKDRQSAVTEQLVDVPARVNDGRITISNSALNRATVSSAVSASANG